MEVGPGAGVEVGSGIGVDSGRCRMGNFEGVKNWFLASCYNSN